MDGVREIVEQGGGTGNPGGAGAPPGPGAGGAGPAGGEPGGGTPGPEGQGGGAPPGGTGLPDDEQFELEPGKKFTRKDLRAGFMMQADYTKKTQDLAKQREEMADMVRFRDWMDDENIPNEEKVKKIAESLGVSLGEARAIVKEARKEGDPTGDEIPPLPSDLDPNDPMAKYLAHLTKQMGDMGKTLKTFQQTMTKRETAVLMENVDKEIKAVREKYQNISEEDLDYILAVAQVKTDKTIPDVADWFFGRLEKEKPGTIQQYLQKKEQIAGDKGAHPAGGGAPPPPTGPKPQLGDKRVRTGFLNTFIEGLKQHKGA